ncbi:hypothetical protein [uncultured Bacteroides sp.]|uniref:hypothetical protein n=1 Tax=uncultured Bacteroides sp. TaxID=162156 RepID=UPI002AABB511|nr:hypothetical protein [uncultured Bacteroides sp.]
MKKIIGLLFCFVVLCSIDVSAALIPRVGYASWNGTTATALLPITTDFNINNDPQIIQNEYYKIYIADNVVYKVEIFYGLWKSYDSPSYFVIEYQDGQTTTIHIADYSSSSRGSGNNGNPVKLQECK